MEKIKHLIEELKTQVQKSRPNTKYRSITEIIFKLEQEILLLESENVAEEPVVVSPAKTSKPKK